MKITMMMITAVSAASVPVIINLDKGPKDPIPIGLPLDQKRMFCKNWIAGDSGDSLTIHSNGNSHVMNVNMEYGFSSLWSFIPQKKPSLSVVAGDGDSVYSLSMTEFINTMSYDDQEFIDPPIRWQFSNCVPYNTMMDTIKTKMTATFEQVSIKLGKLENAVDTTGCLDNPTCVKRLCFPVDPTNIYNYDHSQIILYNADTRMCFKYSGGSSISNASGDWYQIKDSGAWD